MDWKASRNHKSLLLIGPRQTGKTYSVTKFGEENYSSLIVLNFEDHPEYRSIFEMGTDPKVIYERLAFEFNIGSFEECHPLDLRDMSYSDDLGKRLDMESGA